MPFFYQDYLKYYCPKCGYCERTPKEYAVCRRKGWFWRYNIWREMRIWEE